MRIVRATRQTVVVSALLVLALAGCGFASPGLPGSVGAGGRLHQQAQAALARWADAVAAKNQGVVFVGELTAQVGVWEESVGDNNKIALMSGQVRASTSLPTETPPPGEVRWSDGTSTVVALISADQALHEIVTSSEAPCTDCRPLQITAARLTSGSVETSRGPATAPIWEFTVQGTNVKVTRVAVADRISVVPPPWDPSNAPEGISIESARGTADATRLTVSFVGAPSGSNKPCGADYTAEAVESQLAVAVIVIEHPNPVPAACALVGAERKAIVDLASPLGDRAVLEVQQGLPVPVLAP